MLPVADLLDPAAARSLLEGIMSDLCLIVRDTEGVHDDSLDVVTGLLVAPTDDTTVVYGPGTVSTSGRTLDGRCLLRGGAEDPRQPARPQEHGEVRVILPWDTPQIRLGDRLTVTSSRDPDLAGLVFRVAGVQRTGIAVMRRLELEPV